MTRNEKSKEQKNKQTPTKFGGLPDERCHPSQRTLQRFSKIQEFAFRQCTANSSYSELEVELQEGLPLHQEVTPLSTIT